MYFWKRLQISLPATSFPLVLLALMVVVLLSSMLWASYVAKENSVLRANLETITSQKNALWLSSFRLQSEVAYLRGLSRECYNEELRQVQLWE